ncbi:DUF3010 family protein [Thiomicrorhabdus sp. Kp2]|uniref:DUF3010 family protein n=1 Tax=Thiomicrorhabdus sp. Kp2 TaxID=1123518 RepID=UPI0004195FE4|nr:DUF3010 family protein [Thiomicrorhabdus sp. Kp2]
MMRICGVELTGNDAIICLLTVDNEIFNLPECRVRRVTCQNPDTSNDLQYFQKTFVQLMKDYQIDTVVIKERMKRGKFAGGANGFKLEAAIQLASELKVVLMNPTDQKAHLKHYPLPISFAETGLKKFQETAFVAAFSYYASKHVW